MSRAKDLRGLGVGRGDGRRQQNLSHLNVVVFGGLVMDVFVRTPDLPGWGNAIQAERISLQPGGKGFNQAIAARKLGAKVYVIGAVGQDEFGSSILDELHEANIDTAGVSVVKDKATPVTLVFSRPGGDTSFIGWKNASEVRIAPEEIRTTHSRIIRGSDILLTTLEVAPESVSEALKTAKQGQCMTVLNPAPPLDLPHAASALPLSEVDVLIPNEWEARRLAGRRGDSAYSVRDVATFLGTQLKIDTVCITRAHEGCAVIRDSRYREYPAYETEADDTTGASDAFCAALALHMKAGFEFEEAVHYAQAAGAWAILQQGAGEHMPTKSELDTHRTYLEGLK